MKADTGKRKNVYCYLYPKVGVASTPHHIKAYSDSTVASSPASVQQMTFARAQRSLYVHARGDPRDTVCVATISK